MSSSKSSERPSTERRDARPRIPVAEPVLAGNEKKYVLECLESGWISSQGRYVQLFEESFAAFCGTRHAIAVANGTVALHLALLSVGIGPGDEVLVPDLTYIASANAVTYCAAKPVFVDVDRTTWTIDAEDAARRLTPRTRALMPVHLYGHPADMGALSRLAKEHNLFIVEDAAEAHGATYQGRRVGGLGTAAVFSFYGNKIVTTGEGGMVTTNDDDLAAKIRLLRGQGMDPRRRYWFPIVGYNYRLTNLQAAIGLAQMERIDWFLSRRREVASWYAERLRGAAVQLPPEMSWASNAFWLYSIVLPEEVDRDAVMRRMEADGVETRPFFYPMHALPPYAGSGPDAEFPRSTRLARSGINLPSSASLTRGDVSRVADALEAAVGAEMAPFARSKPL